MCLAAVMGLAALTGCDTGDGKQLKPYDPADYPSQTVPASVEDSVDVALGGNPPGAVFTAGSGAPLPESPELSGEPFTLAAPWLDGAGIDARHTCDGENMAPALSWGGVPAGTVEIALSMVDDSAVSEGQPFVHWVIGGLDPAEIALAEGDVPAGSIQALNFFGDVGYGGPCPPPGDEAHVYRLTAYALNQQLELADGDAATEFLATIATISIASTDVTGLYQR
jgi:Raf kinase inhibitor-like YbhB/YbcL family protein